MQIEAEGLSKRYVVRKRAGKLKREKEIVQALGGVSFAIAQGELVGYIGPNGAGKSTTVKILSGILTPDAGRLSIMGLVPWEKRVQHVARIGVVFGQRTQLWWDLPVIDSFALLRDVYRVKAADYEHMLGILTKRLDLKPLLNIPVRQLSLGQRMRCELAGSLIHSPQMLFLDEPTIGLDALTKLAVREFITEINREEGVTVILTTHDMDDVEALCSRVMLIASGELLLDGPIASLRRGNEERTLTADLHRPFEGALGCIAQDRVTINRNRVIVRFDPEKTQVSQLIDGLNAFGIADLTIESVKIEEVIKNLYERIQGGEALS